MTRCHHHPDVAKKPSYRKWPNLFPFRKTLNLLKILFFKYGNYVKQIMQQKKH